MGRPCIYSVVGIVVLLALLFIILRPDRREPELPLSSITVPRVLSVYRPGGSYEKLTIEYPLDKTLFPPEIVAPTFRWADGTSNSDAWVVTIQYGDGERSGGYCSGETQWTPSQEQWQAIKRRSLELPAQVTILGIKRAAPEMILSAGSISISTSEDEVGAPIFYREVNLPFVEAIKDPSRIRWRLGRVSSVLQPRIVLQNLPVCGNCHSFSADGATLGMDVDYANNKASYAITPVTEDITLDKSKIITWSDYKREDKIQTFGLLSQVSPNGRYVVSTVKDRSVFVATPDLAFSQLFFPIQGILAVYDRETKTFQALPGADDSRFVQSNPTWSPDGKYIVFARSNVYHLKNSSEGTSTLLPSPDCVEFLKEGKKFLFDLYRIPFNDGKGGEAEPLQGASSNGVSNFFARYSPDGKWIVFCKAASFMLLQSDSELYIVPAEGGEARRLQCNTRRMNSWHSWSPNGKWLVFASKGNSPYTQLFLTHIDREGCSSPAVLLSRFTAADRAANIPEFVNSNPNLIKIIREQFVDDYSYVRAGTESLNYGDVPAAESHFRKALQVNPRNAVAHYNVGTILAQRGTLGEAEVHFTKSLECDPGQADAHNNLGSVLLRQGEFDKAIAHCREALGLDPRSFMARLNLGMALMQVEQFEEAALQLSEAVLLSPHDPFAHYHLAIAWHRQGKTESAATHYEATMKYKPKFVPAILALAHLRAMAEDPRLHNADEAVALGTRAVELTRHQDPVVLDALAGIYAAVGRFSDAVSTAQQALRIARSAGADALAESIQRNLELYRRHKVSDGSGRLHTL